MGTQADTVRMDLDLSRRYLAVILQRRDGNGAAGRLEPDAFPKPLDEIARAIRDVYEEFGEVPSAQTARESISPRLKPAQKDLLLRELDDLSRLEIPDPSVVVGRAEILMLNYREVQVVLRLIDKLEWANRTGQRADIRNEVEALRGSQEPELESVAEVPAGISVPILDVDALSGSAPYFRDVLTAFMPTTDAPREFLIAAGLMALAGAAGKGVRVKAGTDDLYGNLWLAQLAESSSLRKSTGQGITHKLRQQTDGQWILPRSGSPEGFIQALADRDGAGIQIIGELGAWLRAMERGYQAGHKEVLTELFDSIPIFDQQRTRKKVAGEKEKLPDVDVVRWPALSIYASSTRAWLNRNLDEADIYSGFLPRFLFVVVAKRDRPRLFVTRRQPPEPEALARVVDTLKNVMPPTTIPSAEPDRGPPGRELQVGAEAQVVYEQWVRRLQRVPPEAAAFFDRLETTAIKLALLCAAARGQRQRIAKADMVAATVLGDYFAQAVRYLLAEELALTRAAQAKQKVARIIEAGGEISRSALLQRAGMLKRDLDAVVETLQEEGRITVTQVRKGMRGPKREVYRPAAGGTTDGTAT